VRAVDSFSLLIVEDITSIDWVERHQHFATLGSSLTFDRPTDQRDHRENFIHQSRTKESIKRDSRLNVENLFSISLSLLFAPPIDLINLLETIF